MKKVLIFGNSASGKSTLAKQMCNEFGLAHLDLDVLAWEATTPPTRKNLLDSKAEIIAFITANDSWVIEGCYSDLLLLAKPYATDAIFMNLPIEHCISNAKSRPWEPHKYPSKQAQDENLSMLIDWISQYAKRDDTCSIKAHQNFYTNFTGNKKMITDNLSII